MHITRTRAALALTAVAATAGVAVPVLSSAQTPTAPTVLTFQEKQAGTTFSINDVGPKSKNNAKLSAGDQLAIDQPLYDAAGKRQGTLLGSCLAEGPTKSFLKAPTLCYGTYMLAGGDVEVMGRQEFGGPTVIAILGGTGAYAGMTGTDTTTAKPAKGFDSTDTLTLTPR